jgi:glutamate-ammonia-ligase adenylyltransferase
MSSALVSLFLKPAVPPKPELEKALKPFGFRDPGKVWKEISPFGQAAFGRSSFAELLPLLLVEFSRSADPDLAATHFSAFAEASFHSSQLFQYLLKNPMARQVLAKVLGLSPAQAAVLSQDPPLLYWLMEEDGLTAKFSQERLVAVLERETAAAPDLEGKLNALRRVKRRSMLRLTARDLMGLCDVKDLTFEIAAIADALLERALLLGREKLASAGQAPVKGEMVVLGMGKLGGQELNYNSDIDLLFVYEAEGDPVEANRYFNGLAEFVIQAMETPSALGNLFRVDMNLRPEGMGDLARPLESYLRHYEERSQPWELQALTKARPCAGDKALGERFLQEVEPFIFRKSFDAVYLKEMREVMGLIKRKMEGKGRARTQVKLGRGGIREIEFIIQYQELVHGGRDREVRRRNSLEALEVLGAKGILLKADAQFLAEAYRFLRNVEHRLQQVHGLQTPHPAQGPQGPGTHRKVPGVPPRGRRRGQALQGPLPGGDRAGPRLL